MSGPNFCPNCGHPLQQTNVSTALIIDRNYVFNFGKHQGSSVADVLKIHPTYLMWVNTNIDWLEIPDDILLEAAGAKGSAPPPQPRPRGGLWGSDNAPGHFSDDLDDDIPF